MIEIGASKTTRELEAELGELLRAARLRQNISQERLSDHAGVALGSIRNLENGQGATVATLVRMVWALKLDGWLTGLQPVVSISPMRMLKAKPPRQRARKQKDDKD
jgi:transcriptional regulator with XRE-family HTH domain